MCEHRFVAILPAAIKGKTTTKKSIKVARDTHTRVAFENRCFNMLTMAYYIYQHNFIICNVSIKLNSHCPLMTRPSAGKYLGGGFLFCRFILCADDFNHDLKSIGDDRIPSPLRHSSFTGDF